MDRRKSKRLKSLKALKQEEPEYELNKAGRRLVKVKDMVCRNCGSEGHTFGRNCPYYRYCAIKQCYNIGVNELNFCQKCLKKYPFVKDYKSKNKRYLENEDKVRTEFKRPNLFKKYGPRRKHNFETQLCDCCGIGDALVHVHSRIKNIEYRHNPYSICDYHFAEYCGKKALYKKPSKIQLKKSQSNKSKTKRKRSIRKSKRKSKRK